MGAATMPPWISHRSCKPIIGQSAISCIRSEDIQPQRGGDGAAGSTRLGGGGGGGGGGSMIGSVLYGGLKAVGLMWVAAEVVGLCLRPAGKPPPPKALSASPNPFLDTETVRRRVQRRHLSTPLSSSARGAVLVWPWQHSSMHAPLTSRRRSCHSAAPPLPLVGVSIALERERQQMTVSPTATANGQQRASTQRLTRPRAPPCPAPLLCPRSRWRPPR